MSRVSEERSKREFKPTFENGGFWEYYKDLERQFRNFLEYVPYLNGNENTYSFKLANMIVAIGAYVDSAFKEIARYPDFSSKYPEICKKKRTTIEDYYILSEEYNLPKKKVLFKRLPKREELMPFQQFRKFGEDLQTPSWWQVYNRVKHRFRKNLEKANLLNTRDALSGAFLLNVIHKPGAIRLHKYGVVKDKYEVPDYHFETSVKLDGRLYSIASTDIFYYDYEQ